MHEGMNNPWFVIRDGDGKILESALCLGDEEARRKRLRNAVAIRQTRGYVTEQISEWAFRAVSRDGAIEMLSIESGPP
jgi:hypothetical protein